jgi:hypothetical protein
MRFDAVFFGVVNEEHPLVKADDGAFSSSLAGCSDV